MNNVKNMTRGGSRSGSGRKKKRDSPIVYPTSDFVHIQTRLYDSNGKKLFSVQKAKSVLATKKQNGIIEEYAGIVHDKDVYDAEDIEERNNIRSNMIADRVFATLFKLGHDITWDDIYERVTGEKTTKNPEIKKAIEEATSAALELMPEVKVGDDKETHVHIIIKAKNRQPLDVYARWFDLEPRFVLRRSYKNCEYEWLYLIHAHDETKYPYDASEVFASFDYKHDISTMIEKIHRHEKYHLGLDDIADLMEDVKERGVTLREIKSKLPALLWNRHKQAFTEARATYLDMYASMPVHREISYIDAPETFGHGYDMQGSSEIGVAGAGKTCCSILLAMHLAKEFGADELEDFQVLQNKGYIYMLGKGASSLNGYDGEPIIVCEEANADSILAAFRGQEEVKKVFSETPLKIKTRIMYGSTCVIAKYIIINGIDPFPKFVYDLARGGTGEYSSKKPNGDEIEQYQRRIKTNVRILDDDWFQFNFNYSILQGNKNYESYAEIKRRANFADMFYRMTPEIRAQALDVTFAPLTSVYNAVFDSATQKITELPEMYRDNELALGIGTVHDVYTTTSKASEEYGYIDITERSGLCYQSEYNNDNTKTVQDFLDLLGVNTSSMEIVNVDDRRQSMYTALTEADEDSELISLLTENPVFKKFHLSIDSFIDAFHTYYEERKPAWMAGVPYSYYETAWRWKEEGREMEYAGDDIEVVEYAHPMGHIQKIEEEEFNRKKELHEKFRIDSEEQVAYVQFVEKQREALERKLRDAERELIRVKKKKKVHPFDIEWRESDVEKIQKRLQLLDKFSFDEYCAHDYSKIFPSHDDSGLTN